MIRSPYTVVPEMVEAKSAFDVSGLSYDETYETLEGAQHNRRLVRLITNEYFKPGMRILELNCGTGTDAIKLAERGIHVLATDFSSTMITRVEKKIRDRSLIGFVQTRQLSLEQLDLLDGPAFDGCLSNLGGLNCALSLPPVARELSRLMKPKSIFVAVLMGRWSLWEMASFLGRGNMRGAFRRTGGIALANVGGHSVPVHYYSPSAFSRCFHPWYTLEKTIGLNILTPPPGSQKANTFLSPLIPGLRLIESVIAAWFPFNSIGDHFCAVLRRVGE